MKNLIYEPKGKAGEYSKKACNFYIGCGHGCKYCYVPAIFKMNRETFQKNISVKREFLKKLEKELQTTEQNNNVLLSFTSDVYQPKEKEFGITRKVLELFKKYDVSFTVLTKNKLAQRDFDLYKKGDRFAMTLTTDNEKDSLKIEPFASLPFERFETLKKAKENGIATWVSLEPVVYPEQTLNIIKLTHDFVDLYKIGMLSLFDKGTDWNVFAKQLKQTLKRYKANYYIKKELQPYFFKN